MSVKDEFPIWYALGAILSGVLLFVGYSSGVLEQSAAQKARGGPAQQQVESNMNCSRYGGLEFAKTALFDTCWSGDYPTRPNLPGGEQARALFDCTVRRLSFQVRYTWPDDQDRPVRLTRVEDLITPGTLVDVDRWRGQFEVDFARNQYRARSAPGAQWVLNGANGSDTFRIESGTGNFLCFDHAMLPRLTEGDQNRIFYCAEGLNLETLYFEGWYDIVTNDRLDALVSEIEPSRGVRAFGECTRAEIQPVRQESSGRG